MNKQNYIALLRNSIEEEQKKYDNLPENGIIDRAITLGRINGLLKAWEIANSLEK